MKKTTSKKAVTALEVLSNDVPAIVEQAQALVIKDKDSLSFSSEILTKMKTYLKNLVDDKEKITLPIKTSLKEIDSRYDPVIKPLKAAIEVIRSSQSNYQTALMLKKAEDDAKLAAKVASGYMKPETAVARMEEVETKVVTDSGSTSFRPTPQLKITDEAKIPRKYLIVDESALFADLKAGVTVEGACIEIIQVPVTRRAK